MSGHWATEEDAQFLAHVDGAAAPAPASAPLAALDASRVDLIDLIRNGSPEPEHVPGAAPWLRKGKRYLIPAPAGTGKSLAGLIIAVTTIEHGGTALILDVENGADEYARRLEAILDARDQDGTLTRACQERLSYHTWPNLSLDWVPEEWAAAVNGTDLVTFDRSRLTLSSVGLAEDSNDDYSQFVTSLVIPLARAGTTTIILDNTGHGEKERARGASTKADLNEVVYMLDVVKPFDRDSPGQLRLKRKRSRFSGLPADLRMTVGGAAYTAPTEAEAGTTPRDNFRPTVNMERVSRLLEDSPDLGARDIRKALGGNGESVDLAVALLISDGYIHTPADHKPGTKLPHRNIRPYSRADDPKDPDRDPVSEPCPNRVPRHGERDRVHRVHPFKDTGTDTVPQTDGTNNRVQPDTAANGPPDGPSEPTALPSAKHAEVDGGRSL